MYPHHCVGATGLLLIKDEMKAYFQHLMEIRRQMVMKANGSQSKACDCS